MDTDAQTAPPVVAVMVVHEPGPWFEDVLAGLDAQDYGNLRFLLMLVGEQADLADVIRARVRTAFVRTVEGNPGFGPVANEVLALVEGDNGFFCFLHDDVALEPDAIRLLVEELYRSNAGIVGPKLVEWDAPTVLQHVGFGVDRFGEIDPIVEAGENDQEQHDAVTDVFALPSACLLIRADLFRSLGGFDAEIDFYGEDVDMCWRAHLGGARVMVVPSAKGRHLEQFRRRRPDLDHTLLSERHRMRNVVELTGARRLPLVMLQLVVLTVVEAVVGVFTGRLVQGVASLRALVSLIPQIPTIVTRRRELAAGRLVPDREVVGMHARGSARFTNYLRARDARPDHRDVHLPWRERGGVTATLVWVAVLALVVVGSRHLIAEGIPSIGQFLPFDASPLRMLRSYASGWNPQGLGGTAANPTGLALISIGSIVTLFRMSALHTLGVVGLLVLGPLGIWRLSRGFSSTRARLVTLVVYVAIPLAGQSISVGRWGGLAVYAALPWSIDVMRRIAGLEPTQGDVERAFPATGRSRFQLLATGSLVAAVTIAFEPSYLLVMVVAGILLALVTLVTGAPALAAARIAGTAVACGALGFALDLPWSASLLSANGWSLLVGPDRVVADGRSAIDLLGFHIGNGWGAWGSLALYLPVVAAVLLSRGWRFGWATRAAALVVGFGWLTVLADRDALGVRLPEPAVLLVPVAIGLALAAGSVVAAFEIDVRGAGFGWRQPLGLLSAVAMVIGIVPGLLMIHSGRWGTPENTLVDVLGQLPQHPAEGDYRVLWLGDQRVLPVSGQAFAGGLSYGISDDRSLQVDRAWRPGTGAGDADVVAALEAIAAGSTTRAGRLLAPLSIRYLVVPVADGAISTPDKPLALPAGLLDALGDQLDLAELYSPPAFVLFENKAWLPARSVLTAGGAEASRAAGSSALAQADLTGSTPIMVGVDHLDVGRVGLPVGTVHVAVPFDDGWKLTVDGASIPARPAFGSTMAFDVPTPGAASLSYSTSMFHRFELFLVALAWVIATGVAMGVRLRRRVNRPQTMQNTSVEPVITFDPVQALLIPTFENDPDVPADLADLADLEADLADLADLEVDSVEPSAQNVEPEVEPVVEPAVDPVVEPAGESDEVES